MKVAVIGAGISGLGCAYTLARESGVQVALYESAARLGGHTNTVDVTLDGRTHPVDTGFLVFNYRTYPNLVRLFDELGVPVAPSEMSFAVSVADDKRRIEWAGTNLATVFAQPRNALSPRFFAMLSNLLRFNAEATRIAAGATKADDVTLGEFLDAQRYGVPFRDWYLLPMAAAIWSCPTRAMLGYPLSTFLHFCHNHGLLRVMNRPQWYTVRGGARQYVERIAARLPSVRRHDPVQQVVRLGAGKVAVTSRNGRDVFDHVVLACHSDQALRLLGDADRDERSVLANVGYQRNCALLHTDTRLLPRAKRVWAAWNYSSDGAASGGAGVSVTYLLNKLQPLPFSTPLCVSLNPVREPAAASVIAEFEYEHPIFDGCAIAAQARLPQVQGRRNVWFAGAWTGHGFHEDGLKSGQTVARAILAKRVASHAAMHLDAGPAALFPPAALPERLAA